MPDVDVTGGVAWIQLHKPVACYELPTFSTRTPPHSISYALRYLPSQNAKSHFPYKIDLASVRSTRCPCTKRYKISSYYVTFDIRAGPHRRAFSLRS
eukprot:1800509-Rhodomonas_salina.1